MMKKHGLTLVMAMMAVMLVAGGAWATPYTPSLDDIVGWQLVYATDNSGVSGGEATALTAESDVASYSIVDDRPFLDDVKFTLTFEKGNDYYAGGAAFGSADAQDISAFDSYSLSIQNNNENPWMYALWVGNLLPTSPTTYIEYHTFPTSLNNQSTQNFTLDLLAADNAGIDLDNAYIGFAVGSDALPLDDADFTSETHAAPVPEPGTMALLGIGLLGLAFIGRRKLKIKD